jgi:hypothetical protein
MATDQTIVLLTVLLTVFFLLSVLLFIFYSRNLVQLKTELEANVTHNESYKDLYRVYQESLQKCKEIALNYTASEANCKALNALLEQAGEQRKQLRKDFVEQSELTTQWRQKYDNMEALNKSKKELLDRSAASYNGLSTQLVALESELDRGNEIITWMKADLEKVYKLNAHNEDTIASLLGLNTPVKTLPLEPAIDWNVPQPFPKDYVVPVGINVVAICSDERVIKGDIGITIKESISPIVEWSRYGNKFKWAFCDYELAPINPTDHPLHPEFKEKP